ILKNKKEILMITKKTFKLSIVLFILSLVLTYSLVGADLPGAAKDKRRSVSKTSQIKTAGILNINNIVSWYTASGQGQYGTLSIQGDGAAFPRGTSHPYFADGFVWGGKCYLDAAHTQPAPFQVIRVGGNTYNVGNQVGWIQGTGANASGIDPSD